MPSFAISKFTVLLEPLWVSAEFLLLSTGPLSYLIEQNFAVYDPAPQSLKLPALRAEVAEPGRLRPRLFLLLFFRPRLAL